MKQTKLLNIAQKNMQAGVITGAGFLGNDRRNLIDILDADFRTVASLGLTHNKIAETMEKFRKHAESGLGEFISIAPHFEARIDAVRGKLPCPFEDRGLISKTSIMVKNLFLKKEIIYTDMHIHLINIHGFYQGKRSLFRLDPEIIAEILEIVPG